ncbi:peptide ABC transporter permease [Nocardioides sp. Root190]|uniref:ABC transporter permease n=1 Tax=Nocardioides sp. Root190 TaxID=1736488 RepID=UPI0006F68592|nr:ABC transporter permease [Nocardioides sp. Root190]KRB73293.1 peptide ABC transporter permease [Nocardioides sp. Root190]
MTLQLAAPAVRPASWLGGRWVRFAVRRTGRLLVSVWVLATAAFLMVHAVPGDPVRAALGANAPASLVEAKRASLGLDRPLLEQYLSFLQGLVTGDLGSSIVTQVEVSETIRTGLPGTLTLAVAAFVLAVAVSIPLGVGIAVLTRRGRARRTEFAFAGTSVVLGTIPDFLLGVLLVYLFAVELQWFPVAGRSGPESYVLPVIALAAGAVAILSRIMRVEMLAVLEADYMRTARAKRLSPLRTYLVHALPNAVTATLTIGGLLLGGLVAGTVLVENVFAWPGLGGTLVRSMLGKDYPLVQGIVLVYGVLVLLVQTLVDVLLALLDPRSTIGDS